MIADDDEVVVKCGKPVLKYEFSTIKQITTFLALLLFIDFFYSIRLFISAIKIRATFGAMVNMISCGDGDILPSLQAVPVLFFLLLNILMTVLLFKCFDPTPRPNLNRFMYVACLIGFILVIVVFVVIFVIIGHSYAEHGSLHDGIVQAMNNYSNNVEYKKQIDRLQIEFQCCGSKKYDEWYAINWYDKSLDQNSKDADGQTPFSCCSIKALFPCIHHNVEKTGLTYLYTPEENLSISTRGCYEIIRERKQEIGWSVICSLLLYLTLQILSLCCFRMVQTAHYNASMFEHTRKTYTVWIFGCYTGKVKKDSDGNNRTDSKENTQQRRVSNNNKKPPVPPVPAELQN